jgi:hypothetical protein
MKTTNENTRIQIDYNKIVNFENNEITTLDYVFDDGNNFKGAVGSKFRVISIVEYNEITNYENVIERIIECGVPEMFIRTGAEGCYEHMYKTDEIEDFMFDTSYSNLWDYLRKELNLTENEAYIFHCIGGGRCFDKDFQGNVNPELSEIIREYES